MAYVLDYNDIQPGKVMKTQDGVIYIIESVLGPLSSWETYNEPQYQGCWVVNVKILTGVNLEYASEDNKNEYTRDSVFKMIKHPKTFCAWIHNVSEKELDKLRVLGKIDY